MKKTWVKLTYFDRREILGFAFLVVIARSVAVISLAMMEEFGRKCLQLPQRILLMRQLFNEC